MDKDLKEIITVGEKGQIVIPKRMRDHYKIEKGTKLMVREEGASLSISPIVLDDKHLFILAGEKSLKKIWDNFYDERWNDVL